MKKVPWLLMSLLFPLISACSSVPLTEETIKEVPPVKPLPSGPAAKVGSWVPLYPGIEQNTIVDETLPLAVYAFRIDLNHPDREVIVSSLEPTNGFAARSKTLSTFAREADTLVAINATTFSPYRKEEGLGVNLTTLSIHEGVIQSPQRDPMAALMVMQDGSVELHWPPFDFPRIRYAAGSGPLYLLNGKNRGPADARHPRSGIGLSKDGRYLILMVIDGRKDDYSIGVSMKTAADWMFKLGAWNAMNLDGGGSSTLVLKDPGSGEWVLVNQPSGPPARGKERPVANHIGIR